MMPLEKLLSMQEAADLLGVTTKTLLHHVREGRIAYVNLGTGSRRETRKFRPSDLAKFIQGQVTICQPPTLSIGRSTVRRRGGIALDPQPRGFTERYAERREQEQRGVRALLARQAAEKPSK